MLLPFPQGSMCGVITPTSKSVECSSKGTARYLAMEPFVDGTCVFGSCSQSLDLSCFSMFFFPATKTCSLIACPRTDISHSHISSMTLNWNGSTSPLVIYDEELVLDGGWWQCDDTATYWINRIFLHGRCRRWCEHHGLLLSGANSYRISAIRLNKRSKFSSSSPVGILNALSLELPVLLIDCRWCWQGHYKKTDNFWRCSSARKQPHHFQTKWTASWDGSVCRVPETWRQIGFKAYPGKWLVYG